MPDSMPDSAELATHQSVQPWPRTRSGLAATLGLCTCAIVLTTSVVAQPQAGARNPCEKLGKPSFTATRTVEMPGRTITAKVYVKADREREETTTPDGVTVRITSPERVIIYNPAKNTGVAIPQLKPDPAKAPKKDDANIRIVDEKSGENSISKLQTKQGATWVDMLRFVCRPDGVMLEREFPMQLDGKVARAKSRLSDIELKDIPDAMFEVPASVRIDVR